MPWSEWVQSPPASKLAPIRRRLAYNSDNGLTQSGDLTLDMADTLYAQADADTTITAATQYMTGVGWDQLIARPAEFANLVYGVDYIEKPGSDPTDRFRFIDYDPEDHAEVLGWQMPTPRIPDDGHVRVLSAYLWLDPNTNYPVGAIDGPIAEGTPFATASATAAPGTLLPTPPDPGGVLAWTIGIRAIGFSDTANQAAMGATISAPNFGDGWPSFTYRLPRWRYWKPDLTKPPLRLRQRDDNLFLNAGRIRNRSSRQTTNRLRSYD